MDAGHYHGDVRAANITNELRPGGARVHMGDSIRAHPPRVPWSASADRAELTSSVCGSAAGHRNRNDGALPRAVEGRRGALARPYRMRPETRSIRCSAVNLEGPSTGASGAGSDPRVMDHPSSGRVVETVMRVFDGEVLDIPRSASRSSPGRDALVDGEPDREREAPRLSGPLDLDAELGGYPGAGRQSSTTSRISHHSAVDLEALVTPLSTERRRSYTYSVTGPKDGTCSRPPQPSRGERHAEMLGERAPNSFTRSGRASSGARTMASAARRAQNAGYSDANAESRRNGSRSSDTTHRVNDAGRAASRWRSIDSCSGCDGARRPRERQGNADATGAATCSASRFADFKSSSVIANARTGTCPS